MIPEDLDEMEPGPELGAVLGSLDVDELSGHDRVIVMRAHSRMVSYYQAQLYASMTKVADAVVEEDGGGPRDDEAYFEGGSTEIRTALGLTRRSADCELGLALVLRDRLPRLWKAFVSGAVDYRRVRVLVSGTEHLEADTARRIVDELGEKAGQRTTGQLAGSAAETLYGGQSRGGEGPL